VEGWLSAGWGGL